jgi:hypothetical protein
MTFEQWRENFRNILAATVPLHYYTTKTYLLPMVAILVWGWWCAGNSTDGLPFARAGALVTMLNVVFIAWRVEYFQSLSFMSAPPVGVSDRYQDRTYAAALFDVVRLLSILIGTFIWGFGDVIYIHSHKDPSSLLNYLLFFGAPPKP